MILVVSFSIARFAMVNINDMLAVGRDDSVVQIQIPKMLQVSKWVNC